MKGIIFDLDGTLINSTCIWQEIDKEFLAGFGHKPDDEYFGFVSNNPLSVCAEYTIERYGIPLLPQEVVSRWLSMAKDKYSHEIGLNPGVPELLNHCKNKGIKMSVATSCHNDLCYAVLENCGILGFFNFVSTVDDVGKTKKHPDVYLNAAEKMGLNSEDCAVIEDADDVVDAVTQAGFYLIGYYNPFLCPPSLRLKAKCDRFIKDFRELIE